MGADTLLRIFPAELRKYFEKTAHRTDDLNEIRIRCSGPVLVVRAGQERYLTEQGEEIERREENMSAEEICRRGWQERGLLIFSPEQVEKLFFYICRDSPYAYEKELRKGYLTLAGGHRVGVAGQVIAECGRVESIRNIRFLNIRITHEIIGCGDAVVPKLYDRGSGDWYSTMIIGPPACGKTTLMRDVVRQISDGGKGFGGVTVGLVDERSEIAGCHLGVPQNHVGMRTDVLDCCPKVCGMEMLLRSMSPRVIAVDEIGGEEDVRALLMLMHSGIRLLVSVHGQYLEEIRRKPHLAPLFAENCFDRFVLLEPKYQPRVTDGKGNVL